MIYDVIYSLLVLNEKLAFFSKQLRVYYILNNVSHYVLFSSKNCSLDSKVLTLAKMQILALIIIYIFYLILFNFI